MIITLKLFLTMIFWGGTFVAARIVAQHVGPFSASFLRFFMASLLLLAIITLQEGRIPRLQRHQILPAVLLGMTGIFAYNVFFFLGMMTVTASRASLIVATNPIFISLLSAIIFRERLNAKEVIGIFLCLTGATIVISQGDLLSIFTGDVGLGEIYLLFCVASWVAYSLIGKVIMKDLSPLAAVTYSCLIGSAAMLIPACMEELPRLIGSIALRDWIGIVYLAFFGTVLGFFWYYEGIVAIGPTRASVFINFVPVSGIFFGWLILGETINLSLLVGGLLVMAGVYLTNRPHRSAMGEAAPRRI
jgi:drug/metabolite transporter (DMT)-like permease